MMLATQAVQLGEGLTRLPRVRLADLPTPLDHLPRLSDQLGVQLWMKRDDQTGLALGGNKARKLEYLLGDAVVQGVTDVITTGGSQSNHARITAAACRKLGLNCHLVLDRGRHPRNGNLLLDELLGAELHLIESMEPQAAIDAMDEVARTLGAEGRSPHVVPRGGSVPAGASGYVHAMLELANQLEENGLRPDYLVLATGSCGTHAGVMAGRAALGLTMTIQGISVSRPREAQELRVMQLANATLAHLGVDTVVAPEDVRVDDRFVGQGYGHPTLDMWRALRTVARAEGIILDPVYTGKAMAGLLGLVKEGAIPEGAAVVFLHTGGTPAVFAYADELQAALM